jgi:hypothetical protein
MSTGRVLWIIWCLMWAGFWTFFGLSAFLVGIVFTSPLVLLSALAILIPVGKAAAPSVGTCHLCGQVGDPALLGWHLQTAHPQRPPVVTVWPNQQPPMTARPPAPMPARPVSAGPPSGPMRPQNLPALPPARPYQPVAPPAAPPAAPPPASQRPPVDVWRQGNR